jgi:ribosomal protein L37E
VTTSATNNSPQGGLHRPGEPEEDVSGNNNTFPAGTPDLPDSLEPQTKVCRKCSVQSLTVGGYCPSCGTPYVARRRFANVNKGLVAIAAAVLIIAVAGIAISLNIQHTSQVNAEQAAAASAAEAETKRQAEATRASQAATAAKQAADATKRAQRKLIVTSLEDSILKDAESRVAKGVLEGPITRASCTPLGGGSSDDLTAITGTFECIAVNKTEADGSSSGYRFSATVNWNDASYSWHLGS